MVFFLATVLHTMLYVLSYKAVVHYMGMKKNKAEVFAFIFSCLALTLMGYPSLSLLYYHATSSVFTDLSVNMTGSQWYWSYELSNYSEDPVYMYMSRLDDLNVGDPRFMSVDNRLVLPEGARIQFYITSSDVIHGFNLPTAGVKYDAIPGVLTVVPFDAPQYGLFIGQCSEICGAGHRFMPIVVEVTTPNGFLAYNAGVGAVDIVQEVSVVDRPEVVSTLQDTVCPTPEVTSVIETILKGIHGNGVGVRFCSPNGGVGVSLVRDQADTGGNTNWRGAKKYNLGKVLGPIGDA
jgi:heme/copper-type cytochrome/quinol oxidase subunit 2